MCTPCVDTINSVQGWRRPLDLYNQLPPHSLGFGFCLDYSVKNSFAVSSVCETPTREINLSSANWLHSSLLLLVFFDSQAWDLAFLVRSTMQRRLITRGDVVQRLRGFGSRCSEAGSNCVSFPPNRELPEPFGRSGYPSPHH